MMIFFQVYILYALKAEKFIKAFNKVKTRTHYIIAACLKFSSHSEASHWRKEIDNIK